MIELIKTENIEKEAQKAYNWKGSIVSQEYFYFSSVNDNYRKGKTDGKYKNNQMVDGSPIDYGNIKEENRVAIVLATAFPDHKGLQNDLKVFGEFKEIFEDTEISTRVDIYNKWRNIYTEIREDKNGKRYSFFQRAVVAAYDNQMDLYGEYRYTKSDIAKGISYWMWHTSQGLIEEKRTIELLQRWIKTKDEGLSVIPAEGAYEKKDIDAIIVDEHNTPIVYISIKSGSTMSPETIQNKWRAPYAKNGKNKTKPMLYCGFKNEDDKKPVFHTPPEWEGKLVERMRNRIQAPKV